MKALRAFAPATVANLCCGFDILGVALDFPGDEVEVALVETPGIHIRKITGDKNLLPLEAQKNVAGVAAQKLLDSLGSPCGVELSLHKKMPIGSGIGSSAASAAATVYAVNRLLGDPFTLEELLPFAMEGERCACGSAHADNVAPSLFGGFVLAKSYDPLQVIPIPTSLNLHCPILYPHVEVLTREARALLPQKIPLSTVVSQTAHLATLILALTQNDTKLLATALYDGIAEPVRAPLVPHFYSLRHAALEAGALGCGLSGSGPSLFAICETKACAKAVSEAMEATCRDKATPYTLYSAQLSSEGARILT